MTAIVFWYRNYKGEEGYRRATPLSIRFGTSEWHKEPQWLMLGYDMENNKQREFAMRSMSGVVGNPVLQFPQQVSLKEFAEAISPDNRHNESR